MAQIKDKCYNMNCRPIETGINRLTIYVCKHCNVEISKNLYEQEVERLKRNEEANKKKVEPADPIQDELDLYLANLGVDNTFFDFPLD